MIKKINVTTGTELEQEILHTQAQAVTFPLSLKVTDFIQNMRETIEDLPGTPYGLAANQIAESVDFIPSIFMAINSFDEDGDPVYKVFINPELRTTGSSFKSEEGCYSVVGKMGTMSEKKVRRKNNIELKYFHLEADNKPSYYVEKIYGQVNTLAIIAQHEYDHLLGITIDD